MASFFKRNHGNSVLKQQQQTATLQCYVCFLKAITSSCKSEYLSPKKNHQVKAINASDIPFISSAAAQIPFLSSFWTQAHAVLLKMLKGPEVRALHHLFEHHIMENMKERLFWLEIERTLKETPIMLRLFFPLKTELTVTLINQRHLLQLAHCAQLCSNQSHSGWMSTFQAGRGTAARAQCCNILKTFR